MDNQSPSPSLLRFGSFEVDARTGELTHEGVKVQLHEQPLQLLMALLEHPGELVAREDLIRRLWPNGTFVDFDRGLNKAVNKLRDALKDSAETPQFIETLPRKGYRYVGPTPELPSKPADPRVPQLHDVAAPPPARDSKIDIWGKAALAALAVVAILIAANLGGSRTWLSGRLRPGSDRISSLAVFPLENLSRNAEEDYFADGMTDALITDLAKIGVIRVISRTTVMHYKSSRKPLKEIARELNVDAVVEGTVQRSGNRVRITAQLIQVSTDTHLWAEAYEQDVSGILDLQSKVATDIARQVNIIVKPLHQARAVNPVAYASYLKGRYYFYKYTSEGWQKAIEYFNEAIQADPNFANAYSGLADTYLIAGAYSAIPQEEAMSKGKAAAMKAVMLDDLLADAHFALAVASIWYDWDWAKGEKEFQRGLTLNPNDAMGRNWHSGYLFLRGRTREALDEQQRALSLDPFSLIINANMARGYYWARQYDAAIAQAQETLKLDPTFGVALFWLEGAYRHKGMLKEAVALRKSVTTPERAQAIDETFKTAGFPALMRQGGEMFKRSGALMVAARCYAQIGEADEAINLMEQCYRSRCSNMVTLKAEPDFDGLREDPRFQDLVRRVGLQ